MNKNILLNLMSILTCESSLPIGQFRTPVWKIIFESTEKIFGGYPMNCTLLS